MKAIVYDLNSGNILRFIEAPESMITYQYTEGTEGIVLYSGIISDMEFYILNETVTPRPTFSESISGTTISGLPIPTTVLVEGIPYTITDGSAELVFSLPGTYKIKLSSFPYQDKEVEVTQV